MTKHDIFILLSLAAATLVLHFLLHRANATSRISPLEDCTVFCGQTGGELVLIEGPSPLVCSCVIGDMEVDVE